MQDRESRLQSLGLVLGQAGLSDVGDITKDLMTLNTAPLLSGYSEYTPIQVRSYTKRKTNADMERDKRGDRSASE